MQCGSYKAVHILISETHDDVSLLVKRQCLEVIKPKEFEVGDDPGLHG